jgi:hypothetical protein
MKWQVDELASWQNVKFTNWQVDERQVEKISMKSQVDKMSSRLNVALTK